MEVVKKIEEVEITNEKLQEVANSLGILSMQDTEAWYGLGRNLDFVEPHMKTLFKNKNAMLDRLAKKDENGEIVYTDASKKTVVFEEGKEEEANKIWEEMQEEVIKLKVYKFPQSKFGNKPLKPGLARPLLGIIITE